MKIKNMVARLITIEHKAGGSVDAFRFMPAGEAVEVPQSLVKGMYCKALIDDGSLSIVDVGDEAESPDDGLSELVGQAEELGIKVDKRWGRDRLASEIEAALEG